MRTSPVAHALSARRARFAPFRGMPCAFVVNDDDPVRAAAAGICDLSALERCGLKGAGAAEWLQSNGVAVSEGANTFAPLPGGGLVARLARTEFLVEDGPDDAIVPRLRSLLRAGLPKVTPVLRQDCALALVGSRIPELLVETCNVDFASLSPDAPVVTLTQMVGVSVTVVRRDIGGRAGVRVWCDYTSGPYLWDTLVGIAEELGGGAVGTAAVWPRLTETMDRQ